MPLIKHGAVAADTWIAAIGEADVAAGHPVIVDLATWQARRQDLIARRAPVGVRLASDQSPDLLQEDIAHIALIALEFPKFTDGRAYSHARILRERLGFEGELRAVGHVLRDQLAFMQRCGFDSYDVRDGTDVTGWLEAIKEFSAWYQPAADTAPQIGALRRRGSANGGLRGRASAASVAVAPAIAVAVTCAAHWAY